MGTEVRAIAGVGSSILGPWDTSISRLERGTERQQARPRRCSRHRRQHGLRTLTFPPPAHASRVRRRLPLSASAGCQFGAFVIHSACATGRR